LIPSTEKKGGKSKVKTQREKREEKKKKERENTENNKQEGERKTYGRFRHSCRDSRHIR
jgi:hypothetical protein